MGIESGHMHYSQITTSSNLNADFREEEVQLSSSSAWSPFIASENEWIQFDFSERRIIEGIITKGKPPTTNTSNGCWTEAYKVMYSSDCKHWNPLTNDDNTVKVSLKFEFKKKM